MTLEEILQYGCALLYWEPIINETAFLINEFCLYDPYFISCVFRSSCPKKDLTTWEGVYTTVQYEVGDEHGGLANEWIEYLDQTLSRVNEHHAK